MLKDRLPWLTRTSDGWGDEDRSLSTEELEGTSNGYTVNDIGAPKAATALDAETVPTGSPRQITLGSERGRAAL